jgi:hypothetical protein
MVPSVLSCRRWSDAYYLAKCQCRHEESVTGSNPVSPTNANRSLTSGNAAVGAPFDLVHCQIRAR